MSTPMYDGTANQAEEPAECPSCRGTGCYDVGDCEDGVTDVCPECEGTGFAEPVDDFVPEWDA